jgi:ribonuclease D
LAFAVVRGKLKMAHIDDIGTSGDEPAELVADDDDDVMFAPDGEIIEQEAAVIQIEE